MLRNKIFNKPIIKTKGLNSYFRGTHAFERRP